jgi:N-acetylmuramoyl-L-alanine amidase
MTKGLSLNLFFLVILTITITSCSTNPYKKSEKVYNENLSTLNQTISEKESTPLQNMVIVVPETNYNTPYLQQLSSIKDTLSKMGKDSLINGVSTSWVGTVNFNLRKPNFIIIHHTAQDSLEQTLKTFTLTRTQVSAHYVIGKDGKIVHMLNDYLRAWHAGNSSWGKITDMNSASIGIELDNNGLDPFSDNQIINLIALLTKLKKEYNIPTQNIIGHSDIAPARKKDPSALFPWKLLALNGFGLWPDEILENAPANFDPELGLRIIGYNTTNLAVAIQAFKLHFIQTEVNSVLDQKTINTIYNIYKKQ